jgi:ABC-type sugar transport system permease subunit
MKLKTTAIAGAMEAIPMSRAAFSGEIVYGHAENGPLPPMDDVLRPHLTGQAFRTTRIRVGGSILVQVELGVSVAILLSQHFRFRGAAMAASLAMTVPVAVLFFSMQRYFVGGLTAGATKG